MYKFLKSLFYLFLVVVAFSSCRKQALDAYYGRPDSLAQPIYQTLQARGNFTTMLACIDKAGYTSQLSTAGYWTLFAPNDAAFQKYFTSVGSSQIDAATANKIVSYCLVNSGYVSTPLNGLFSGNSIEIGQTGTSLTTGVYLPAYKRRTMYHVGIDTTTVPNVSVFGSLAGQNIKVIAQNTPIATASILTTGLSLYYDPKDINNKYIPYFTPYFFQSYGLSASDYTFLYPNSSYTNSSPNFNVVDGNVVKANTVCENGVVQEINTVPLPLPSIEKYLATNPNYSHFYSFIQRYGNLVTYSISPDATHVNQVNTGSNASVYVKQYSPLLAFAPSNENLASIGGSTFPQYSGNTIFAPTNQAFDNYLNNVLLEHYTVKDPSQLSQGIIVDYINAHMSRNTIWPSKLNDPLSANANNEAVKYSTADVSDRIVCSNGIFYGVNKEVGVSNQGTNVFATVYGRVYLDPGYTIMAKALSYFTSFKTNLTNPLNKYTMVVLPDAILKPLGFSLNLTAGNNTTVSSGILYLAPGSTGAPGSGDAQLTRIINLGIFLTPNNELANLSGTGIYGTAGLNSAAPEYVKYTNNQFYAAGNQDANTTFAVNPAYTTCTNGIVYYPAATTTNTIIPTPVTNSAGTDIFNKGQVAPVNGVGGDPYYMFYKFLSNTLLWNATTKAISGIDIGADYTILIPSNAAMQDAVNNGWLPGTGTGAVKTPNFTPSSPSDINLVQNFFKYHIVKAQIAPDGKKGSGSGANYVTELFSNDGANVLLKFVNNPGSLQVIDGQGRVANVGGVNSIVMADHSLIEPIDTYLQYLDSTGISPANPTPTKY